MILRVFLPQNNTPMKMPNVNPLGLAQFMKLLFLMILCNVVASPIMFGDVSEKGEDPFSKESIEKMDRPLSKQEIVQFVKKLYGKIPDQLKKSWTITTKEDTIVFVSKETFKTDYPVHQIHVSYEMKIISQISNEEILKRVQEKNERALKLNFGTKTQNEWYRLAEEISKIDVPVYSLLGENGLICTKQGELGNISNLYTSPYFKEIEEYILGFSQKLFEMRM